MSEHEKDKRKNNHSSNQSDDVKVVQQNGEVRIDKSLDNKFTRTLTTNFELPSDKELEMLKKTDENN